MTCQLHQLQHVQRGSRSCERQWSLGHPSRESRRPLRVHGPQTKSDPKFDSNFYYGDANVSVNSSAPGTSVGGSQPVRRCRPTRAERRTGGSRTEQLGAPRRVRWDVTGDGRTSVRGGYGMSYERNFGNVTYTSCSTRPVPGGSIDAPGRRTMPVFVDNSARSAALPASPRRPGR